VVGLLPKMPVFKPTIIQQEYGHMACSNIKHYSLNCCNLEVKYVSFFERGAWCMLITCPCHIVWNSLIADINAGMFNLPTDIQSVLKVSLLRLYSVPGKHYFIYNHLQQKVTITSYRNCCPPHSRYITRLISTDSKTAAQSFSSPFR
jgi:hypothetical protein